MTHERYAESLGAYLLGALPEPEHAALEHHLETCSRCREEVAQLRVAADALPHAVEPLTPPPALKASLMEVVEREAGANAAAEPAAAPARKRRWRERLGGLTPALSPRPATAALGAAALLALGVAAGYGIGAIGGDDARTIAASVDTTRLPPGATGTVTVPGDGDHAVLRVSGLPPTPPGTTYQVWLSRDGRVEPESLFTVGRDGRGAAAVPDSVDGADAVMVTRERAGGAPAPTERPILTVSL